MRKEEDPEEDKEEEDEEDEAEAKGVVGSPGSIPAEVLPPSGVVVARHTCRMSERIQSESRRREAFASSLPCSSIVVGEWWGWEGRGASRSAIVGRVVVLLFLLHCGRSMVQREGG